MYFIMKATLQDLCPLAPLPPLLSPSQTSTGPNTRKTPPELQHAIFLGATGYERPHRRGHRATTQLCKAKRPTVHPSASQRTDSRRCNNPKLVHYHHTDNTVVGAAPTTASTHNTACRLACLLLEDASASSSASAAPA